MMITAALVNQHLPDQILLQEISAQYTLDPDDTHGLSHWGRVLENGLLLADRLGGDCQVISLFAIFHDACRENQHVDHGHGDRGAALANKLLRDTETISKKQLNQLITACSLHTEGFTEAELTVQLCWDADRLDLARAGIMPESRYLCTEAARDPAIIRWANQRSLENHTPEYVQEEWRPLFRQ
jgi:uncharacterized protein